jgi:hypothetical protein
VIALAHVLARVWLAGTAIFAASGALASAAAMDACGGRFSAAALHPLPVPAVIKLEVFDDSSRSLRLGQAFTDGIRRGGMRVDGTPTIMAVVSVNVLGGSSYQPRYRSPDRNESAWLEGGLHRALPDLPTESILLQASPAQATLLTARIELRDAASRQVDWIGSIQCTPQGTDDQQLAFEIGELVGRSAGKRIENAPL